MKKSKRIFLSLMKATLKPVRFISNNFYKKYSFLYFKWLGINFVGKPKYVNYDVNFDLTKDNMITIGENTVITKGCVFLTHDYSIECGLSYIGKEDKQFESQFLRSIKVGNNVFIGYHSIILPGTTIGDNVIVGAGSVCRGNLESGFIYSGNPAVKICKLDEWAMKKYTQQSYIKGTKRA